MWRRRLRSCFPPRDRMTSAARLRIYCGVAKGVCRSKTAAMRQLEASRPVRSRAAIPVVGFALAALLLWVATAGEAKVPTVAFFGFQLINTSLEPTSASETKRLEMIDRLLEERLDNSGRFKIVPLPPEVQQKIAAGPEIR